MPLPLIYSVCMGCELETTGVRLLFVSVGTEHLSTYLTIYKVGDIVDVKVRLTAHRKHSLVV